MADDLAAGRDVGTRTCARDPARAVASSRPDLAWRGRQGLLHRHSRHAAAPAALAALFRARFVVSAVSLDPRILPVALSSPGMAVRRAGAHGFLCRL